MHLRILAIVALVLFLAPAAAQAQWVTRRSVDDFTGTESFNVFSVGENGKLLLSVSCVARRNLVFAGLLKGGTFQNAIVETRWDEGEVRRFTFQNGGGILHLEFAADFAGLLRVHKEMRMRVTALNDEFVTDRFDLSGARAAIDGIDCHDQ